MDERSDRSFALDQIAGFPADPLTSTPPTDDGSESDEPEPQAEPADDRIPAVGHGAIGAEGSLGLHAIVRHASRLWLDIEVRSPATVHGLEVGRWLLPLAH